MFHTLGLRNYRPHLIIRHRLLQIAAEIWEFVTLLRCSSPQKPVKSALTMSQEQARLMIISDYLETCFYLLENLLPPVLGFKGIKLFLSVCPCICASVSALPADIQTKIECLTGLSDENIDKGGTMQECVSTIRSPHQFEMEPDFTVSTKRKYLPGPDGK